ncbi:uncharacterized protein LOC134280013 [Saccostrea cucullata]|uniref:uncharacterized protein LOC134280013 n=1 Tax=Saccostrea cuccullata TaxID=36930 RepID=UPI002ED0BD88
MRRGKGKHVCLHFLVVIIQIFDTVLSCPASTPTITYVSFCPTSQEEWEKAAERKNCESIAAIQNCTDRSKFQYHCLMNHWKNATLEVCAPIFYLQGYCAEFNIQMKQVAEIYDEGFECLKFNGTHKCPRRYPSIEAYKYQRCYRYKNISTYICTEKLSSKDMYKDNSWIALVFIIIVSLLIGILAFVVVMMRKGICNKLSKDDSEEGRILLQRTEMTMENISVECQKPNKNAEQNKLDDTEEGQIPVHVYQSEMPKESISEAGSFSSGFQRPNKNSEQKKLENTEDLTNLPTTDGSAKDETEEETDLLTADRNIKQRPSSKTKRAPEMPKNAPYKNDETKVAEQVRTTAEDRETPTAPPRKSKRPANDKCSNDFIKSK